MGARMASEKYDITYIAVRLRHKLLQFVEQFANFLRVLFDAAKFFLGEVRRDLFAQKDLRDHVADVRWAGSRL